MKGRVEFLGEEESGLISQSFGAMARENLFRKKVLLVIACCLLCICILGVPTAYQLLRKTKAAKESASSIQIQNRSLPDLSPETAAILAGKWQEASKEHSVQWEDTIGLAFTKNGMKYNKPCLEVPKTGDYFIYTQIALKPEINCSKDSKPKGFSLSIHKISDNYRIPEMLMSSTEFGNEKCMRLRPIYLAAVVNLQERDRLVVNASDIKMVDCTKEYKTFFGAFLL